ncbi:MAG: hypothetical protein PHR56_01095 [Dehalococcoidales bacterium]|nr:hypothetical protein [Dehalococcoidales bacterium]
MNKPQKVALQKRKHRAKILDERRRAERKAEQRAAKKKPAAA